MTERLACSLPDCLNSVGRGLRPSTSRVEQGGKRLARVVGFEGTRPRWQAGLLDAVARCRSSLHSASELPGVAQPAGATSNKMNNNCAMQQRMTGIQGTIFNGSSVQVDPPSEVLKRG